MIISKGPATAPFLSRLKDFLKIRSRSKRDFNENGLKQKIARREGLRGPIFNLEASGPLGADLLL